MEQGLILQVGACGGRRDGGEVVCCVVYHLILNAHVRTLSVIVSHVTLDEDFLTHKEDPGRDFGKAEEIGVVWGGGGGASIKSPTAAN